MINYYIEAKFNAGIHTKENYASVGCRQILSGIWCTINFCIQSISSSCNYCTKAKIVQPYMQTNWMLVLDADILLPLNIVCSIIPYFQSDQEDNTTKVGNQLKPCNTRSCIQFCFWSLGLHPTIFSATRSGKESCWIIYFFVVQNWKVGYISKTKTHALNLFFKTIYLQLELFLNRIRCCFILSKINLGGEEWSLMPASDRRQTVSYLSPNYFLSET